MTYALFVKLVGSAGIIVAMTGTVFLWIGSPAGYSLSAYADAVLIKKVADNNQKMKHRQWIGILLMVLGAGMQIEAIFLS